MRHFGAFVWIGTVVSQDVFLNNQDAPSVSDLKRAVSKPRQQFRGDSYEGMNAVLNQHLLSSGKTLRACENFTLTELHSVRAALFKVREPALDDVYRPKSDGRRMTIESMQELTEQNDRHEEMAEQNPTLVPMLRDGLCHETVMWYVHHLTEAARKKMGKVLPALPVSGKHSLHSANPSNLEHEVVEAYAQKLTCQACHTFDTVIEGASWPDWPEEVSFTAKGYGPFPFFPAASAATTTSVFKGWYSRKQMKQLIYHSSCDMSMSGGPSSGECNELFTEGDVHISTDRSCCRAITGPNLHKMPAFAQDFYKTMNGPTTVQYSGTYYTGKALFYYATIPISSTQWYYTKLDGTPVELGEGPYTSTPQTRCNPLATKGSGVWCVYHQYDPSSFDYSSIDSSIFDDPSVCSGVSTDCVKAPPR